MKTCTKCKQTKDLSEYYSDKRASDGKASMCKVCNLSYRTKNVGKNAHLKEIPDEPEGMRFCVACKTMKTLVDFDTETHTKKGKTTTHYRRHCRICRASEVAEYNKEHPEISRAAKAKWLLDNPAYHTNYRAKNLSELLRKARDRYRADPVKANLQVANARRKKPEHYKMLNRNKTHNRRVAMAGLPKGFKQKDWVKCLAYFGNRCAVCGQEPDRNILIAMDHWIPINNPNSPGHVPTNVVPLCHARYKHHNPDHKCCNNSKGAKNPVEWLQDKYPLEAQAILDRIQTYFDLLS